MNKGLPGISQLTGLRCADKSTRCSGWASAGQCTKSGWIFRNCLISCKGKCDTQPPQPSGLLNNGKHFLCFYSDIETRVKVWDSEKCWGTQMSVSAAFLNSDKLSKVFLLLDRNTEKMVLFLLESTARKG